jgi:hypothetical protein
MLAERQACRRAVGAVNSADSVPAGIGLRRSPNRGDQRKGSAGEIYSNFQSQLTNPPVLASEQMGCRFTLDDDATQSGESDVYA